MVRFLIDINAEGEGIGVSNALNREILSLEYTIREDFCWPWGRFLSTRRFPFGFRYQVSSLVGSLPARSVLVHLHVNYMYPFKRWYS